MAKSYCKKYFYYVNNLTNKPNESKSFRTKKFAEYWIAEHEKLFHKQFKAELRRCLY